MAQQAEIKHLKTINPEVFVSSMVELWRGYGNQTSPAIEEAWSQLAATFNRQINDPPKHNWAIIPMPTGAGKTQGLALYCALMAKYNPHPGILIVTQFTKEADKLAATINTLAGKETATAYHYKVADKDVLSCGESPVLIITHAAFKLIIKAEAKGKKWQSNWRKFMRWGEKETRRLVVIDEALDIVEQITITVKDLTDIRANLPPEIIDQYPNEMGVLDSVIASLALKSEESDGTEQMILAKDWTLPDSCDFDALLETLYQLMKQEWDDTETAGATEAAVSYRQFNKILSGLQYILYHWARFSKATDTYRLTSAYVVLPPELSSAVILDATAMPNRLYDMLCTVQEYIKLPPNIRNYQNVTLHVFWGYKVGKVALMKETPEHFAKVIDDLSEYIGKKNKVLFCTQKDVEKNFQNLQGKYKAVGTVHWGDIAGKNQWNTYDSMVMYGISFLDQQTPKNILLAFMEWHKQSQGLYEESISYYDEETDTVTGLDMYLDESEFSHDEYQVGHIVTNIIQAMNRVRCRRVIDSEGNCEPTNIYLFLSNRKISRTILDGVIKLMPNIKVIEFKKQKKEPKSRDEDKLVAHLKKLKAGNQDAGKVQTKLGISDTTMRRLVKQIKTGGNLKSRLDALNITYAAKPGKNGYKYFSIGKSGGN